MNETAFPHTSKEMKEIHFIGKLGYVTLAPWVHPAHFNQCGSYHSNSPIVEEIRQHADSNAATFATHSSAPGWTFADNLTCWYNRIVVPDVPHLCERIIQDNHDSILAGHPGRTKTLELIQRNFWWPTIARDCFKYVDSCSTCQRTKPLRQKPLGLLSPNETPQNFWQIISCNFVTDLPSSKGFNSVMVCVDRLSKMVRLIP